MQRESYWDYMGLRMREENNYMYGRINFSPTEKDLYRRVEELEHKVSLLGGDPRQLELDV